MKKFQFKLQRLLEIREKKEEEARIDLAKVSGEYQKVVNEKTGILDQIRETRHRLSTNPQRDLNELRAYDRLQQDADSAIIELDKEIAARKKVMDAKLAVYTEKKKDRRAVEILREKAYARYEEENRKMEQNEMDEIGKNIYLKQQQDQQDQA